MDNKVTISRLRNHPDANERRQAAADLSLNSYFTNDIIEALAAGLADSDSGVKDICSRALSYPPEKYAHNTAILLAPYLSHENIEFRNLAVDIIISIGKRAVGAVIPYLMDEDQNVIKYACDILGRIGTEEAVQPLLSLLLSKNMNIRAAAIEALGSIGEVSALNRLFSIYDDNNDLKPLLLESIGKIGGKNSQDFLISQLKNEHDTFLQLAAIDALAFSADDLNICNTLLEELPLVNPEAQIVLLKTIYAIAYRQNKGIKLPDELKYIARNALFDSDYDNRAAGLLALGESYKIEDVDALVHEAMNNNPDTQHIIVSKLLFNSDTETTEKFFEQYCLQYKADESTIELFSLLPVLWNHCRSDNKKAVIETTINLMIESKTSFSLDIIEIFLQIEKQATINVLKKELYSDNIKYAEETLEIIERLSIKELTGELSLIAESDSLLSNKIISKFIKK